MGLVGFLGFLLFSSLAFGGGKKSSVMVSLEAARHLEEMSKDVSCALNLLPSIGAEGVADLTNPKIVETEKGSPASVVLKALREKKIKAAVVTYCDFVEEVYAEIRGAQDDSGERNRTILEARAPWNAYEFSTISSKFSQTLVGLLDKPKPQWGIDRSDNNKYPSGFTAVVDRQKYLKDYLNITNWESYKKFIQNKDNWKAIAAMYRGCLVSSAREPYRWGPDRPLLKVTSRASRSSLVDKTTTHR